MTFDDNECPQVWKKPAGMEDGVVMLADYITRDHPTPSGIGKLFKGQSQEDATSTRAASRTHLVAWSGIQRLCFESGER
jgi:hypothetical protein